MRSVEQVQLKEIPERPHRLGSYPNRGMRKRYVPDWEATVQASQPRMPCARLTERGAGS